MWAWRWVRSLLPQSIPGNNIRRQLSFGLRSRSHVSGLSEPSCMIPHCLPFPPHITIDMDTRIPATATRILITATSTNTQITIFTAIIQDCPPFSLHELRRAQSYTAF